MQPDSGLNMAAPTKCAMCGGIAKPAIGLTVDSSEYWEAAEATQTHQNTGKLPRRRRDGRTDLLVCTGCYNERQLLEVMEEESNNKDDAHEDAEFQEALRLSQLDGPPARRSDSDEDLAEALRLSQLDSPPARPARRSDSDEDLAKALLLSKLDGPPEERSDSDEEPEALRQSGLEAVD